jgi:serine/threonine-protein kinase
MDSRRWDQIHDLFLAALEQPASARDRFLQERCGDDAELRREVASLLAAHETEGVVEQLTDELTDVGPRVAAADGRLVGPYRLRELVGEGGMGAVYLAERADGQYERQVALKLVRLAAGPSLEQRLMAERQILARLSHPNIAQLLDGGLSDSGQPYFAMEYVAGRPLDRYCDEERLGVADRVRLFLDVCAAVDYAHRNLVIHRDLKPGNVLVTADGQVKLLDFGIARLVVEDPDGGTSGAQPTGTLLRALTPAYASPEQIRGEPMTTAADVYSLGVMLYELLSGQRPYRVDGEAPSAIERVICEVEPTRPSTAVAQAAEAQAIGAARGTAADPLRRKLSGDLDIIVLKALRKEPGERYATAADLRDDLCRWLDGLPIEARPATIGYRAGRFVRRHRIPVAAAALVLVSLIGGLSAAVWQGRIAAAERDRARVEATKAEQVADFLSGLFEESDPELNPASEKTARELLAAGATRIERELADQPVVQAQMMDVIGGVYQKLALYDEARPLLAGALARRTAHLEADHPDRIVSLRHLAALHLELGEYDPADSLLATAIMLQRGRPDTDPVDLARTLDLAGVLKLQQEDLDASAPLLVEALRLREQHLQPPHRELSISYSNLGNHYHESGDLDRAEESYRRALAITRELVGPDHPEVAIDLNALGYLLYDRGDIAAAAPLFEESLRIRRKVWGDDHPALATGMNNLAIIQHEQGLLDEAERLYRDALHIRQRLYGDAHHRTITSYGNLGNLLHERGRLEEAEALYRKALALERELQGDVTTTVGIQLNNVGRVLQDQGRLAEAEAMLREALAVTRQADGEGHPYVGIRLNNLAAILHEQGRFADALPLHEQALAIFRETLGEDHWRTAYTRALWGDALRQLGDHAAAGPLLRAGHAGLVAARGEDDRHTRSAAQWLAALDAGGSATAGQD